jgi:hypothetical protein
VSLCQAETVYFFLRSHFFKLHCLIRSQQSCVQRLAAVSTDGFDQKLISSSFAVRIAGNGLVLIFPDSSAIMEIPQGEEKKNDRK